jgi:hypothetical protein
MMGIALRSTHRVIRGRPLASDRQLRYVPTMTETKTRAMPSPLPPTEAELAEWNALTREEQVARYREALAHPDCAVTTDTTMAEILAEAQARVARRRG